jgi:hypothetical protein
LEWLPKSCNVGFDINPTGNDHMTDKFEERIRAAAARATDKKNDDEAKITRQKAAHAFQTQSRSEG